MCSSTGCRFSRTASTPARNLAGRSGDPDGRRTEQALLSPYQRLHELIVELHAGVEIARADPLVLAVRAPVSLLDEQAGDAVRRDSRGTENPGVAHAGFHAGHHHNARPHAI